MTDWLPWGLALMIGTFTTLALTLRAIQETPAGGRPNLRKAWIALIVTVILTFVIYALYLIFAEQWVWYQK